MRKTKERSEETEEIVEFQKTKKETEKNLPLRFKGFYLVNTPYGYVGIKIGNETGKLQYFVRALVLLSRAHHICSGWRTFREKGGKAGAGVG